MDYLLPCVVKLMGVCYACNTDHMQFFPSHLLSVAPYAACRLTATWHIE